jgi:ABC-2 type transport system permease protein
MCSWAVILVAAFALFQVPMEGSFAAADGHDRRLHRANLAVGFTFSTMARNQLQAMQMTFFFFLPSMLLSGFMFPFRAMPVWAQRVGEVLPLTHFLRIVRGILLKGNSAPQVLGELWPMLAFMTVVSVVALKRYRQTLD